MLALLHDPVVFAAFATLLGLFVGSFLNVVIHRLPRMMERDWHAQAAELRGEEPPAGERFNLATPRSRCPHCGHQITLLENIPLVSWLVQGGKCRHCAAPISIQYPAVEALTALLCVASVWQFGFGWQGFGAIVLSCFLVALSGIDLRTQYLPASLTLPLLWLGLIASTDNLYMPAKPALIGAALGYLSLWSVCWVYKQFTGKQGMGHGDFKLLAALGAWCGWQGVLPIILLSSLVGAIIGTLWLRLQKQDNSTPIPFGPYLAIAGWIVFMWGEQLVDGYLRISGIR